MSIPSGPFPFSPLHPQTDRSEDSPVSDPYDLDLIINESKLDDGIIEAPRTNHCPTNVTCATCPCTMYKCPPTIRCK